MSANGFFKVDAVTGRQFRAEFDFNHEKLIAQPAVRFEQSPLKANMDALWAPVPALSTASVHVPAQTLPHTAALQEVAGSAPESSRASRWVGLNRTGGAVAARALPYLPWVARIGTALNPIGLSLLVGSLAIEAALRGGGTKLLSVPTRPKPDPVLDIFPRADDPSPLVAETGYLTNASFGQASQPLVGGAVVDEFWRQEPRRGFEALSDAPKKLEGFAGHENSLKDFVYFNVDGSGGAKGPKSTEVQRLLAELSDPDSPTAERIRYRLADSGLSRLDKMAVQQLQDKINEATSKTQPGKIEFNYFPVIKTAQGLQVHVPVEHVQGFKTHGIHSVYDENSQHLDIWLNAGSMRVPHAEHGLGDAATMMQALIDRVQASGRSIESLSVRIASMQSAEGRRLVEEGQVLERVLNDMKVDGRYKAIALNSFYGQQFEAIGAAQLRRFNYTEVAQDKAGEYWVRMHRD